MSEVMERPVTQSRIFWTEEEWHTVARLLMQMRPEYAESPAALIQLDLRKAISTLPPERQRPISTSGLSSFMPALNKAYAQVKRMAALEPVAEQAPEPVVEAVAVPESEHQKRRKIFWRPDEYLALAHELHRTDPGASFPFSSTLVSLTPAALREAERRVLPEDRCRHLDTVSAVKPNLLEAFKQVKEELAGHPTIEAKEAADLDIKRRDILEHPEKYGLTKQAPPPPPNPYEVVFKPLFDLFFGEFMKRMAQQYPAPAPQPAAHTPMAHAQLAPEAVSFQPPRKPRIGIVGAMSQQTQDVAKAFPQFEIIGVQQSMTPNLISKLHGATRVIGMTSFMKHSPEHALIKHFGEKYCRIDGSASAIKRQINLWITTGVL